MDIEVDSIMFEIKKDKPTDCPDEVAIIATNQAGESLKMILLKEQIRKLLDE